MIDNATSKKRGSWKSRMVSAFDVAAKPVKGLVRDSRTQEAFDKLEADTLLESSSVVLKRSIIEGGAKNPITTDFLKRYQELFGDKKMSAAERKRAAAKLDLAINDYAARHAEELRMVRGLQKGVADMSGRLELIEMKRFNEIKPILAKMSEAEEVVKRLAAQLENEGRLGPSAEREMALINVMLGTLNSASLREFNDPGAATARAVAFEQRALAEPKSDAARLAAAMGGDLRRMTLNMFTLEAKSGRDFSKLGQPVPLTEEELLGLYLYTDQDFAPMNLLLITGAGDMDAKRKAQLETKIEFCRKGLAKLPNYPRELYPVIRFESDTYDWRAFYPVGGIFHNRQFWSTGATAGAVAVKETPVRLVFRIYGASGKDVAAISSKQGEGANKDQTRPEAYLKNLGQGEVLFAPQTPFKVMSISEEPQANGRTFVYITVMEQPR